MFCIFFKNYQTRTLELELELYVRIYLKYVLNEK